MVWIGLDLEVNLWFLQEVNGKLPLKSPIQLILGYCNDPSAKSVALSVEIRTVSTKE